MNSRYLLAILTSWVVVMLTYVTLHPGGLPVYLFRQISDAEFERLPAPSPCGRAPACRSEEHTSELQSLMRISSAVFCFYKKQKISIVHQRQAHIVNRSEVNTSTLQSTLLHPYADFFLKKNKIR